jgi:hypothetical protein
MPDNKPVLISKPANSFSLLHLDTHRGHNGPTMASSKRVITIQQPQKGPNRGVSYPKWGAKRTMKLTLPLDLAVRLQREADEWGKTPGEHVANILCAFYDSGMEPKMYKPSKK